MSAMKAYIQDILDMWNTGRGHCHECPFNLVNHAPEFALGSENGPLMVIAQSPGGVEKAGRKRGETPYSADEYFEPYRDEQLGHQPEYPHIAVLRRMTEGTPYNEVRGIYYTNLAKCHAGVDMGNPEMNRALGCCEPYLKEEFRLIDPRLIVTFGVPAFKATTKALSIPVEHMTMADRHGLAIRPPDSPIPVLPFLHWSRIRGRRYYEGIQKAFVRETGRV